MHWNGLDPISNKSQYAMVGGETSKVLNITHEIPRRSVLGPLLFLLYINDLPNTTKLFKYILYTNDRILSIALPSNEIDYYADIINSELKNVDLWLSSNRILLNKKVKLYFLIETFLVYHQYT